MSERLTVRASGVVGALAREEALRLNDSFVRPEHIFLALVREGEGVAGKVLAGLGIPLDEARQRVESHAAARDGRAQGRAARRGREIPFSSGVKRTLKLAREQARRLGHSYIGTEHLLLGLFYIGGISDGVRILNVLDELRLNAEHVRDLILHELASRPLTNVGARNNVLMCRVTGQDLESIDTLVEAGVGATRSEAAAWLIRAGIEGNKALFDHLQATVSEIRRLREQAQAITRQVASGELPPAAGRGGESAHPGA